MSHKNSQRNDYLFIFYKLQLQVLYGGLHGNITSCNFRACKTKKIDETNKMKNISGWLERKYFLFSDKDCYKIYLSCIWPSYSNYNLLSELCCKWTSGLYLLGCILLLALLFIPNLFSHNSVQRFTFPRDLFLADSIYMSTSCLNFQ